MMNDTLWFGPLLWAYLYVFLFVVTADPFVLGGALSCALLAVNHYRFARRHERAALKVG